MEFLKNPETKKLLYIHLLLTLLFVIGALWINILTAALLAIFSMLLLILHLYSTAKRYTKIMMLCDDISKVLHGDDTISIASYTEGEMSILYSEIQKMTIRLREQHEMLLQDKGILKRAMADISHQLKTPLTSINLILSMLGKSDVSANTRIQLIQELAQLLHRTEWLIDDMLKLSQFDAGVIVMQNEEISVKSLIANAVKPLEISMELRGITFNTEITDTAHISGDFKWLSESITNILKNCMEHTEKNGAIKAVVLENPIFLQITICDTGCGIAESDLPHIFKRFYKCTHTKSQGFGIGLALTKEIIDAHNGVIFAENCKNGGAKFIIRFYKLQTL